MADSEEQLSEANQESIATVLAFSMDEKAMVIAHIAEPEYFDPPFDEIVARCSDYRKKYNRPPGKGHIDDIFADVLSDREHKQHNSIRRFFEAAFRQADNLDVNFVYDRINSFVVLRKMRSGIARAAERFQKGGPARADDVDDILRQTLRARMFEKRGYGFTLDEADALSFLDRDAYDYCRLGIPEFDENGVYPARKELFLFLAARNRGKSMFLHHCGKQALMKGWQVVHYTLENSGDMTASRYFQTLFNGVKRTDDFRYADMVEEDGRISLIHRALKPDFIIEDKDKTRKFIASKQKDFLQLKNLRIREFPTGRLSYELLERDLDDLAVVHKFIPTMILVDYPQIMKLPNRAGLKDYSALTELTVNLRGLAVERDAAVVVPQQGNRSSERAGNVRGDQGGGSIEMLSIADNALTYSQTASEEEHGLARLFAQKVRNDRARFTVLISQHYPSAQFCMSSRYMSKDLAAKVKTFTGASDGEEIDGEEDFVDQKKARS